MLVFAAPINDFLCEFPTYPKIAQDLRDHFYWHSAALPGTERHGPARTAWTGMGTARADIYRNDEFRVCSNASSMVRGDFVDGDYFIDCANISLSTARAVFSAWFQIFVTISAYGLRSIYRSNLTSRLVPQDQAKRVTNLWTVSPPTNPSEVFALRGVLFQDYSRTKLPFILASLTCILVLVFNAASTAIANATVVSNVVLRERTIQGRLAYNIWVDLIPDSVVNLTSRVQALEKANAPLTELFDFVPDDQSDWVYVSNEWNNSWHGQCTYNMYPATNLVILPSDLSDLSDLSFQDLIPSLATWLPQWASANETGQGANYMTTINPSGNSIDDVFALYAFTNPADSSNYVFQNESSVNVSLANFVTHNIPLNSSQSIIQTAFQADLQVAECTFSTSDPGNVDNSRANGIPSDIAISVASIVGVQFQTASPFIPPTARQMVRYWQAYMSVKDNLTPHPVQRRLSVNRPVVQIRLSVLLTTLVTFVAVLTAAIRSRVMEPLDPYGRKLLLPSSRIDWMVQAARPLADDSTRMVSTPSFIKKHKDLVYVASLTPDGQLPSRIAKKKNYPVFPTSYESERLT